MAPQQASSSKKNPRKTGPKRSPLSQTEAGRQSKEQRAEKKRQLLKELEAAEKREREEQAEKQRLLEIRKGQQALQLGLARSPEIGRRDSEGADDEDDGMDMGGAPEHKEVGESESGRVMPQR